MAKPQEVLDAIDFFEKQYKDKYDDYYDYREALSHYLNHNFLNLETTSEEFIPALEKVLLKNDKFIRDIRLEMVKSIFPEYCSLERANELWNKKDVKYDDVFVKGEFGMLIVFNSSDNFSSDYMFIPVHFDINQKLRNGKLLKDYLEMKDYYDERITNECCSKIVVDQKCVKDLNYSVSLEDFKNLDSIEIFKQILETIDETRKQKNNNENEKTC